MWSDIGFLISATLTESTPLLFVALGGMVNERSGIVNIGLEGMMTIGAFFGASIAFFTHNGWLGFLAAGMAGMILAALHAYASIKLHADQIISGLAINFIGPGLALFISRLLFNGSVQTTPLPESSKLPNLFAHTFPQGSFLDYVLDHNVTVYIAIAMVFVLYIFFKKTALGLHITSVGEHPEAADSLGIHVRLLRTGATLFSGFMAGLGGAAMTEAIISRFSPSAILGQGYIALAALIFGHWKPFGVFGACLFFGSASALEIVMVGSGNIHVSSTLFAMFPYIATIFALVVLRQKGGGPAANGKPYVK